MTRQFKFSRKEIRLKLQITIKIARTSKKKKRGAVDISFDYYIQNIYSLSFILNQLIKSFSLLMQAILTMLIQINALSASILFTSIKNNLIKMF